MTDSNFIQQLLERNKNCCGNFPDKELKLTVESMACMSDGVCTPPESFDFMIEIPKNEEKSGYLWVFWVLCTKINLNG